MRLLKVISSPRFLLPAVFLLVATVATGNGPLGAGDPAPEFSFQDIHTGETKTLEQVSGGKPLLLVFLQTACRTCVLEMVGLKKVMAEGAGCPVLGVFIDIKPRGLAEYVSLYRLPFTFTWDQDSTRADAYGVSLSPTSFLLDPEGNVAAVYSGFTLGTEKSLRDDLRALAVR